MDAARDADANLWRRYFVVALQGMRPEGAPLEPLPVTASPAPHRRAARRSVEAARTLIADPTGRSGDTRRGRSVAIRSRRRARPAAPPTECVPPEFPSGRPLTASAAEKRLQIRHCLTPSLGLLGAASEQATEAGNFQASYSPLTDSNRRPLSAVARRVTPPLRITSLCLYRQREFGDLQGL